MLKFKKCHLRVLLVALICCGGFLGVVKQQARAGENLKPDLVFGEINISTGWGNDTKEYKLTDGINLELNERLVGILANIKNSGDKNVDSIEATLEIVDSVDNTVYTNIEQRDEILNTGEEKVIGGGWSWTPSQAGEYIFKFSADSNNKFSEISESNNIFTAKVNVVESDSDETYYSTNLKTDRKVYQAPEKVILELWSYSKNPNVDSDTYFVDIWLTKILKQGTIEKELIESGFNVSTRGFSSFKEIDITQNDYFNKNGSGEYSFTVCKVNACAEGSTDFPHLT